MAHVTYYRRGNLFGWYNDFEKAGDRIPRHSHAWDMHHSIIVLRGSVQVTGLDLLLKAGDVAHIEDDRPHSVIAQEDGTRTLHLLLNDNPKFQQADGEDGGEE